MDLTPRISVLHVPAHQNFAMRSISVINVMDMIWIVILKSESLLACSLRPSAFCRRTATISWQITATCQSMGQCETIGSNMYCVTLLLVHVHVTFISILVCVY